MFANFRLSFTWLHTWFGLVLGYVLMVAFFFGSLSVFDREIDRWALPGQLTPRNWSAYLTHRDPVLLMAGYWPVAGVDLMLLASAVAAFYAARKLQRRARNSVTETAPEANLDEAERA